MRVFRVGDPYNPWEIVFGELRKAINHRKACSTKPRLLEAARHRFVLLAETTAAHLQAALLDNVDSAFDGLIPSIDVIDVENLADEVSSWTQEDRDRRRSQIPADLTQSEQHNVRMKIRYRAPNVATLLGLIRRMWAKGGPKGDRPPDADFPPLKPEVEAQSWLTPTVPVTTKEELAAEQRCQET